jgi:hypothetical protein
MNRDDAASEQATDARLAAAERPDPETALLQASPRKGFVYEEAMHPLLEAIAARFGDEYVDTSKTPGLIPNCKKGDGVLIITDWPGIPAGGARVVFEMSDSRAGTRRWNPYLEESERNRGAHAAIALVRHRSQIPRGKDTRAYGTRRIVIAFDPEVDDPDDVLSTVITLVRSRALFEAMKSGTASSDTASENLTDAQRILEDLPEIRMIAARARTLNDQVVNRIDSVHSRLGRSLIKVVDALEQTSPPNPAEGEGPA